MNPEEALRRQIELYRAMTGEQRLEIALNLHARSLDVAREEIRQQFPDATSDEVECRLRERIRAGYDSDAEDKARIIALRS